MPDADVVANAAMIYGEGASEDFETMHMMGSTPYNRMKDNPHRYGFTIQDVLLKPNQYYAVQNKNEPFMQAIQGKFPNEKAETKWKQAMQIAYGLKKWQQPVKGYSGNIDLVNRPVVKNSDGSVSTELSKSFNFDGEEVLIPTIVNGKKVSDKEAMDYYRKTGEHLGKFKSVKEADAMAEIIHSRGLPPIKGKYFFRKGEATGLRKKLKPVSKVGKYDVYDDID